MATLKQTLGIFGLMGAAGAVWTPQILRKLNEAPVTQEEVPAIIDGSSVQVTVLPQWREQDGEGDSSSPPAGPRDVTTRDMTSEQDEGSMELSRETPIAAPADSPGTAEAGSEPESDAGGAAAQEQGDLSTYGREILRAIDERLDRVESYRDDGVDLGSTWTETPENGAGLVVTAARRADLEAVHAFLAENLVTGILSGGEESLALVGPRVVRTGDRLAGELLIVSAIERDHVLFTHREGVVRHELSPFEARGRGSVGGGSGTPGAFDLASDTAGEPEFDTPGAEEEEQ